MDLHGAGLKREDWSTSGSKIWVRVERGEDKQLFLDLVEQGPGIVNAQQPYVFDRFYRVDRGRTRQWGGTGLGLSITRWAAEAHSGDITLKSEEGHGSTSRVSLPVVKYSTTSQSKEGRDETDIGDSGCGCRSFGNDLGDS
jgi:signal transduction histidine kinase